MAEYEISISRTARKQPDKLPDAIANQLIEAIESLRANPRQPGCKKMKGRAGYRIREGDTGLSMPSTTRSWR